ncbi:MAG: Hsp20 family protein [Novosphingobium sp.]
MNRLDFTPYRRSMVGFDRIFDMIENQARSTSDNFPPFNIEKHGDDNYRITLAVAGYKPDDIEITAQQNLLVIQGLKPGQGAAETGAEGAGTMLHVGIAQRGFDRRFELADYVRVANAGLEDGLLTIDLVREVPDAMLPKKIAIGPRTPLSVVGESEASQAA